MEKTGYLWSQGQKRQRPRFARLGELFNSVLPQQLNQLLTAISIAIPDGFVPSVDRLIEIGLGGEHVSGCDRGTIGW
jgi:hypothetical protein